MGIINILFFLLILGPFPHDGFCCIFSCFRKSIGQSIHFRYVRGRSSRPEVFCKKGIHINFAKLTGKYLHQSLFKNTFFNKTLPVPAFVEVTNFSLRLKIGVKIKIELLSGEKTFFKRIQMTKLQSLFVGEGLISGQCFHFYPLKTGDSLF